MRTGIRGDAVTPTGLTCALVGVTAGPYRVNAFNETVADALCTVGGNRFYANALPKLYGSDWMWVQSTRL
jgi:hypothetical protein